NLSAGDVKAEARALANSASNANASSSQLVKERLDAYDISTLPDIQALADVTIMLCIRSAELTSLHITDAGKPGVKRFNRFLKDYDLIPRHLHKIGAVYAVVVHDAKNLAYAMTIAREALHHNPNNNTSPAQKYVVFNTISKSLFNRLKTDHRIRLICDPIKNLYKDAIDEICYLDLQFWYKGTYHSLDNTDVIDFEIRKNPIFDLVLGQGWLWVHEAKIIFGFSPRTYDPLAKIIIDDMYIPLIDEGFNKVSPSKNNLSNSIESRSDLSLEELVDMFKKLSLRSKDKMH
ncbi:41506_t:CDS:2, partial [Gigaspora margarita]